MRTQGHSPHWGCLHRTEQRPFGPRVRVVLPRRLRLHAAEQRLGHRRRLLPAAEALHGRVEGRLVAARGQLNSRPDVCARVALRRIVAEVVGQRRPGLLEVHRDAPPVLDANGLRPRGEAVNRRAHGRERSARRLETPVSRLDIIVGGWPGHQCLVLVGGLVGRGHAWRDRVDIRILPAWHGVSKKRLVAGGIRMHTCSRSPRCARGSPHGMALGKAWKILETLKQCVRSWQSVR
jgi:hypothetical protein